MPSTLSKIFMKEYSMSYNCYEVGHTWTPFCSRAALDMGWSTFSEAVKMYSLLYTFNQLMAKKFDSYSTGATLKSILQSSFFLGFNAYSVIFIFCLSRRLVGKFYYVLAAHIPAIIGSYMSILLERKSRRSALSFYVANVASETVWRKFVHKGWIRPIPNGEVIIFAVSTASLLYLIHRNGFGKDPVSYAFRFLLGTDFVAERTLLSATTPGEGGKTNPTFATNDVINIETSGTKQNEETQDDHEDGNGREERRTKEVPERVGDSEINAQSFIDCHRKELINGGRIINCCGHSVSSIHRSQRGEEMKGSQIVPILDERRTGFVSEEYQEGLRREPPSSLASIHVSPVYFMIHPETSLTSLLTPDCLTQSMLGFIRSFLIGFTGQSLMSLVSLHRLLLSSPFTALRLSSLQNRKSLQLGLFLGSFTALFKLTNCILWNLQRQKVIPSSKVLDAPRLTFVSGLVASSSMIFYPSPTTCQYMLWKLIETVYFLGVKSGRVKYVEFTLNMLYAVSTAQLFYVAVMEPKMMRKSYTKWLNRVTRGSFALLNRNIIDIFGTESSHGYPYHEPVLQLDHISDKFKESVLVWMI